MFKAWSVIWVDSPEIFYVPVPEKTQILLTPWIRKSHITVIPHITDSENSVCLQFIHIITTFLYFS